MAYKIEGIERVDYEKDGRRVLGNRVYFSYDLNSPDTGRGCDAAFLRDELMTADVQVGAELRPLYNKFGRCEGFIPVH